jgi:UDP-N-acetylmuramate dehydrogenase
VNPSPLTAEQARDLQAAFGKRLQHGVPLAPYTSARIGGPADYLLVVRSSRDLAWAAQVLWQIGAPFRVLGAGANVLVADGGVREVVILNQARQVRFPEEESEQGVWAESGAALAAVARLAVQRGWTGLEWAVTVPGTVGGSVVGNAGAYQGDMAHSLRMVEILQQDGQPESWSAERLEYGYRDSWLKRHPGLAVVLAATFGLNPSTPEAARAKAEGFTAERRRSQPPGASMGSTFRNPPGDHAGRLIEEAGLKGRKQGGAQISPTHANFIVNVGGATAADVLSLIQVARSAVKDRFGIALELEIEFLGDWGAVSVAGQPSEGGTP